MQKKQTTSGIMSDKVTLKLLTEKENQLVQLKRALEIEASLEKVRSSAMAMHSSTDLTNVALVLVNELENLSIEQLGSSILELDEETGNYNQYSAHDSLVNKKKILNLITGLNVTKIKFGRKLLSLSQSGVRDFTIPLKGQDLHDWIIFTRDNVHRERGEAMLKAGFECLYFHFAIYHGISSVVITTLSPMPKDDGQILRKMADTFAMSYRRFLDLQKAEAQAREAEIELALERVRARTMAMQHSNELGDASFLLVQQVLALGIKTWGCAFNIYDENQKSSTEWFSNEEGSLPSFKPPREGIFLRYYEIGQKVKSLHVEEITGKACQDHYEYLCTLPVIGDVLNKIKESGVAFPSSQIDHVTYFKYGYLLFITFEPVPEAYEIFKRFAKVFEQTYTRFLDLQKAEAQAREAEIELALERVRARTMAMQRSEELTDAAVLVFHQIEELGIHQWGNAFQLWDDDMKAVTSWTCTQGVESLKSRIPATEDPVMINIVKAAQNGEYLYVEEMGGEALENHYRSLTSLPVLKEVFEKLAEDGFTPPKFQVFHAAYFSYGYILFITHEPYPEAHEIFKRFAKVFEQTYTRFLDLQKAEAQAREAQIEAALERVRSRTMAMHNSEELQEVINSIYERFIELNINVDSVSFTIFYENSKAIDLWIGTEGEFYDQQIHIPYIDFGWTKELMSAKEGGSSFLNIKFPFEEKNKWWQKAFEISDFKHVSEERKKYLLDGKSYTGAIAIEKNSGIQFNRWSGDVFSEHDQETQKRFARVFEQTYTRFLDLQKAEAQAREAQIEIALERVRSRTMAMHNSEELSQVVALIYNQIKSLGFTDWGCSIIICDEESSVMRYWYAEVNLSYLEGYCIVPLTNKIVKKTWKLWQSGIPQFDISLLGKEKEDYTSFMLNDTDYRHIFPEEVKEEWRKPKDIFFSYVTFKYGLLEFVDINPPNPENYPAYQRFAKVFEQTYTRFLDLQKAEAQARESQIEAALERVRSRSMGMHKSEELRDIIHVIYEQFIQLDINIASAGFATDYMESDDFNFWFADSYSTYPKKVHIPYLDHPQFNNLKEAKEKGVGFFANSLTFEEKNEFFDHVIKNSPPIPQEFKDALYNAPGYVSSHVFLKNLVLYILNYTDVPFSDVENAILMRFGKAFEQAYIRFLDLQKAEAQAREAKIEAALEGVRAKAMAMHNSEDLPVTASVVFDELGKLGITTLRSGISLQNRENRKILLYTGTNLKDGNKLTLGGSAILDNHPVLSEMYDKWIRGEDYFPVLKGDLLKSYYEQIAPNFKVPKEQTEVEQYGYFISYSHGFFYGWAIKPFTEDEQKILKRFASVVDLTFKRYFDLQRAEQNAREAQIEAALERVRSKSLAMHHSDELHEVIREVFIQLAGLNLKVDMSCIDIFDSSSYGLNLWVATSEDDYPQKVRIPITNSVILKDYIKALKEQKSFLVSNYTKRTKDAFFDYAFVHSDLKNAPEKRKKYIYQCTSFTRTATISKHFSIWVVNYNNLPYTEQENEILKRFTKVFDQSYTRFLDLQKAEAQAREGQIEVALEKLRSRSMAMHNAEEMEQCAAVLFQQLEVLGIEPLRCGIAIPQPQNDKIFEVWTITTSDQKKRVGVVGQIEVMGHPLVRGARAAWKAKKSIFSYDISGKEMVDYFEYITKDFHLPEADTPAEALPKRLVYYHALFNHGTIYGAFLEPLPDGQIETLTRFAKVFEQTYTRFLDLQKAEVQTKEAVKQASLDRVRGEIASMRSKDDLDRITPLIWQEFTALGVPFIRCGVFIMDEENKVIQTHLSSPDGKSLGVYNLPYDDREIAINLVHRWRKKKAYKEHWDKEQFLKFMETMAKRGFIQSQQVYQGTSAPPESLDLHFVPFKQGMLYVGNVAPLQEEEIGMVQALAQAFSIAYARYEDFTQLEHAKNQIENTLGELKSTQTQLIHAEKMASLGELTAGIAHEIQNPLNFVNNFSEVSADLLLELKEELAEGNSDEVEKISKDLIQNLEKIHHHGQRASSIVKGMLEHSRTGAKKKELTDLNALADEYLRLSYHGLRAKDKSFNADFKTDLDNKMPKVKVISQDIGRVILNMINNAFYAVSSKANSSGNENYKPAVFVSTKLNDKQVEIVIQDNGDGIPKKNMDKIFQPFFTTKPTGQGTGLGLSLSYDIITQGHDGHLEVESDEGEGTRFLVSLPIS